MSQSMIAAISASILVVEVTSKTPSLPQSTRHVDFAGITERRTYFFDKIDFSLKIL